MMKDQEENLTVLEPNREGGMTSLNNENGQGRNTTPVRSLSPSPNTTPSPVKLYVYDLSLGMARNMSLLLLGRHIEGIWHTGVVVFGKECFFGRSGILQCPPGGTRLGQPNQIINVGVTHITEPILQQHIAELCSSTFRGPEYNLFTYNCNTFSNELLNFLCGGRVPNFILDLPRTVLNTPLGQAIIEYSRSPLLAATASKNNTNPPRGRGGGQGPAILQALTESIQYRILTTTGLMSDEDSPTASPAPALRPRRDVIAEVEEEERREREEKMKNREPPIVFRDFGNSVEELLDELEKSLANVELNDDEMRCMGELREYALGSEGSWILSDEFLNLISRILLNCDPGIPDESRINCLKVLAWLAVTKDDVILVLHQDRRDHVIMRYASHIDQLSPPCQEAISLLICNLFENLSTSEWLLYISEWESDTASRTPTSNIRVTTKVGVHALLSKEFKDIGSALVYNFLMKEVKTAVFDDVAVEMSLALLQFLSEKPAEPLMWRGLKSLLRCCQLARTEVPPLIKMVGPPPTDSKGTSVRCDEVIASIDAILSTVSG